VPSPPRRRSPPRRPDLRQDDDPFREARRKHDSSGKYLWFQKKGHYNGGFSYNGQDYAAKYSFDILASIQKHVADGGSYGYVEIFDSTGARVDRCATDGGFDQNGWYTLGGGTPFRVKGR
jgi:hypothetical protein